MRSSTQKSGDGTRWSELLTLLEKRRQPPSLTDDNFVPQKQFLEDTSSLVCVLCTRRAGKSYGAALRLLRAAYAHPGSSCLYVALTRDSAKRILWKDVLKSINRKHSLGAQFNETTLSMTLPNGSVVYLLGADTDEEEKQKLLGQKYAEVVIDESASFTIDLRELVYGILKPAVADYRGAISLIGTPGNLKKGLFFELTQGQDPLTHGAWTKDGWSGHRWSAADNPHMATNWKAEIEELKKTHPRIEETPLFQQHYLGRWVIDDSRLVYRYVPGRNDAVELRNVRAGRLSYVLGIDLGYEDATAFVVCAYSQFDRCLYVVESSKQAGLDVTSTAERIRALDVKYGFDRMIVDNANKQAVEEMKKRHGLALHPADKTGKTDFIELMNGDFIQGYIRLLPGCGELKEEYENLIWDDKSDKRQEHPNCDNHCTDAALYAWRYAYSYLAEVAPKPLPAPGTEAWVARRQKQAEDEVGAQMEKELEEANRAQRERAEELEDMEMMF